jgi:glycosyltransferase involved in cell wall biosynthesis
VTASGTRSEYHVASTQAAAKPVRVCLLISSLEFGGAERQVVEMARAFDRSRVHPIVCSLSDQVPLAAMLPRGGADLHVVKKRGRLDFSVVFRVAALFRKHDIDVAHAFLFDCEIAARLAAMLTGVRVVSSERNADYDRPRVHRLALRLTRSLFDVMVANSHAGKQFNIRTQGLAPSRIEVVHNGVDTERFQPNRRAGEEFRRRIGVAPEARLVGMVASYKRQKGHDNFLRMADIVRRSASDTRFVLVGGPVGDPQQSRDYQDEMRRLCRSLGLDDHCVFVGNQQDVNAVYNACDVTVLLSRREGTPNTVLESMACGVPVVVSDVADNALIVAHGETGFIVPVDDPEAAATRVVGLLESEPVRRRFGAAARSRACSEYSLVSAATKLERIYVQSLSRGRSGQQGGRE